MTTLTINEVFGRINQNGDVDLFDMSGDAATRIDANVYPIGSSVSARHEHPEGITISKADAERIGVQIDA